MIVTDMTSVALGLVFRFAIDSNIETLEDWKHCMALLTVNRMWREAAKLHLYSSAIISIKSKQREKPNQYGARRFESYSDDHSNISLIASNGGAHLVTGLRVVSNHVVSWKTIVDKIYNYLSSSNTQWTNIRKLDIDCTNAIEADAFVPTRDMVTAVINVLPNISDIAFIHPHTDKSAENMCSRFISNYKNQLTAIRSNVPLAFLESRFISKLTSINLALSSTATHQLPYVCSDSLRVLCLYQVTHDFSWRYCQKDMTSDQLTFSSLEVLLLRFKEDAIVCYDDSWIGCPSDARRIYQLHCPKLKSLTLKNCPPSFGLFQPSFCATLTQFVFHGAMSALALCGGLCFESTTNLTVEISGTSIFDDMPEFCKATNWLFSNGRQAEIPCKLLSGFQFALEPNLAMWGSLTSLTLNQPVMFKSLLQLLYCLPNITALAIHQLLIENTSTGNMLQNHYQEIQQIIAKPLDTKLETLLIKFSVDNVNQVTRVIQTLLIEIRTLRKLKLQPKYTNLACRFKDSAPYQYPHIIGVAIENCK